MRLHNRLRDGKAQACSLTLTDGVAAILLSAVETLEKPLHHVGRNGRTGVLDRQPDLTSTLFDTHFHSPGSWRIAQRIRKQIAHCPPQHQAITHDRGIAGYMQSYATIICQRFIELKERTHLVAERNGLTRWQKVPMLGLGQQQHVGHRA